MTAPDPQPPAAPETDVSALREVIERGLRKCRVEDAPVPLIKEHDLHHVTHMVAAELTPLLAAATADRVRRETAEGLRLARLVERDMAERALLAWRSADARRGLSDHAALEIHADALTRWSERLRMAFDGIDWHADREAGR